VDTARNGRVRLGLIASGEVPEQLAVHLSHELPDLLAERVSSDVAWEVPVAHDRLAAEPGASATAMIDAARRRMLEEGWDLAVCITDLPVRAGRRPVVADASAMHGVALVSLPALGAVALRRRTRDAVVRLVDGLMGESLEHEHDPDRRARVGRRLAELARPVRAVRPDDDDDVDVRFVAAVVRGNLRLLAGMVRANRPWRVVARLSRALAASLATVALAIVTSDIWLLSDAAPALKLAAIAVVSLVGTVVALVVVHGLWERAHEDRAREQVVLFNVATTLTLALGVLALYLALFALSLAGEWLVLDADVVADVIGHPAGFQEYVRLAFMAAALATVGGALGSALETDDAVREAAYGYRPERQAEREGRAAADG
jgi:hypothetical protein